MIVLSGRYTGQILKHITRACFLDPRLKLPAFLTDERDKLISDLKEELELVGQQVCQILQSLRKKIYYCP